MLKLALVFGEHMVLQREKTVKVWGQADPGARVTVCIQEQTVSADAGSDGAFSVKLAPLSASEKEDFSVSSSSGESLAFRDVAVGDVWLAGGQSNMEYLMYFDRDLEEELAACDDNGIRMYDYPEVSYVGQIDEHDYTEKFGFWRPCDTENLPRYIATGYYFAKEIRRREGVPVGILSVNWGGTGITCWMPRDVVASNGGQQHLDEFDAVCAALDLEEYEAKFAASPANIRTDIMGNIGDEMLYGCDMQEFMGLIMKKMAENGIDPSTLSAESFMPAMGPKHEWRPCGVYESMLLPVVPYGIKGVIWYQGCSDSDSEWEAEAYGTLFPALIAHWRELWSEPELPFLFVQLPGFGSWNGSGSDFYPITRRMQQQTADTVANVGMAVISDAGMELDIHPKKKRPAGNRLALQAEKIAYGRDVLCEAPRLSSAELSDGCLALTFDHAGQGLRLGRVLPLGEVIKGGVFSGLQVFQNGEELLAEGLTARADGNRVILTGESIKAGVPTRVALAQTPWFLVNLYNSSGIPARPGELVL